MIGRSSSISVKVSVLYVLLAIINIAFFTVMIFENQVDLIVDNTKLNAKELVSAMVSSLKKFSSELGPGGVFRAKTTEEKIREADKVIRPLVRDYCIFSESGRIILRSSAEVSMPDSYVQDGLKAITNRDFTGKEFYLTIREEAHEMYFYVPLHEFQLGDSILFIRYGLKDIGRRLRDLYVMIVVIVIVIAVFHFLFAILLFRIIIRPIQLLYRGSIEIADGNFDVRVQINRRDEIGALGRAFNAMAESIQEKIQKLSEQMKVIYISKEKIERMAITDELTGLYNRRQLFKQLEIEVKRSIRYNDPLGFIMIDVDYFKNVNDTYGHQAGDTVLKEIATSISKSCREVDFVARYGGEEFAVIASSADSKKSHLIAERIRSAVEKRRIRCSGGIEIAVTISLGLVSFGREELKRIEKLDLLVNAADEALYRAKESGRNRTEVFQDDRKD